ncbi:MAG TPA: Mur ligase family protein, partial [Thermomicrobiales bacterium]|nr:Mur ligase family protein [Thermomicrobiales bacterium]
MNEPFDYSSAMAFIHERSGYDRGFISNPFAGDEAARLGLLRTERVLVALGRPDLAYPILHVAGSKGKGSTSTLLASIFTAAGWKCGRFLSPHLHRFNERFAIDDKIISDSAFAARVRDVREAALAVEADDPDMGRLTAWELSTVIALLWFQQQACDVVVLEVGMGGTLDATNVVQPAASLITRLDLEHTAILGNTIEEIAANKAGIIKAGAP